MSKKIQIFLILIFSTQFLIAQGYQGPAKGSVASGQLLILTIFL